MAMRRKNPWPEVLAPVRQEVLNWPETQTGAGPMPYESWDRAVALALK